MPPERSPDRRFPRIHFLPSAKAQLTLVEHALCPLETERSLRPSFLHEGRFSYTDGHRNRREGHVRINAVDGLSAHDEFYLWGLLSLALGQQEPSPDFSATPYHVLQRLGVLSRTIVRGSKQFDLFRASLKRLAGVRYWSDAFYDPVRGEHRESSFGLLNYSLPLDAESKRAWRFAWDPIFFEFATATGGALMFDLATYRSLDPAGRRLYLFLKKLFWRQPITPNLDVRNLAVDVLGFSPMIPMFKLKWKLSRIITGFLADELLILPEGCASPSQCFTKHGVSHYSVQLSRGPAFDRTHHSSAAMLHDSPLYEPLRTIGLGDRAIAQVLRDYPPRVVEQWADITQAARERNGDDFFTKSPAAYFMDNVKAAAAGTRTPPDWWRELQKREREVELAQERAKSAVAVSRDEDTAFQEYLRTEACQAFEETVGRLFHDLTTAGTAEDLARDRAADMARVHFRNRFRQEHPEWNSSGLRRLGDFIPRQGI